MSFFSFPEQYYKASSLPVSRLPSRLCRSFGRASKHRPPGKALTRDSTIPNIDSFHNTEGLDQEVIIMYKASRLDDSDMGAAEEG